MTKQPNLALKLVDPTSTVVTDFRCGNSLFSDTVWDFTGLVNNPHWNAKKFQLDFRQWDGYPRFGETIKRYMVSELMSNSYSSAHRKYQAFSRLRTYLDTHEHLESFCDFSRPVTSEYFKYLLTAIGERGEQLHGQTIKKCAQVIKEVLLRGSVKGWDVPKNVQWLKHMYEEAIIKNKRVSEETKFGQTNKVLPQKETIDRIIADARTSEDVLTGVSIILSSQLGLRINEFINLEDGCLKPIGGEMHIEIDVRKTTKEPTRRLLPANELVNEAINRLSSYTYHLRQESGKRNLFLVRKGGWSGEPVLASYSNWTKNRLRPFVKKHDLRENGEPIELTSHVFRHIFGTYAQKNGMKIQDVAEMMGHATIKMTETYSHIEEDIKNRFEQVFSSDNAIAGKNAMRIKEKLKQDNPFIGRTVEDMEKLRNAMKIQLLPHGFCLHHPMRNEPCAGDGICQGCDNFITTPEFMPVHQARIENIQNELETTNEGPYAHKLRTNLQYLMRLTQELRAQQEAAVTKK